MALRGPRIRRGRRGAGRTPEAQVTGRRSFRTLRPISQTSLGLHEEVPMRRFAVASFLAASFSLVTVAPVSAGLVGIHPGVKVGVSIANFNEDISNLEDVKSRSDATFGGYVRLDLGHSFSIQPELQYIPNG